MWVIAAVIGAFVGYPTWQDYVSQQEAKLKMRAYVEARALGPTMLKEGVPPRVRETIQNTGRTPAYNDAVQAAITVADYPLTKKFERVACPENQQPDKRKWFVGKLPRPETARETPFTAEEITAIQTAKSALYYHGTVCYRDIFHEPHRTDFVCFGSGMRAARSPFTLLRPRKQGGLGSEQGEQLGTGAEHHSTNTWSTR